MPDKQQSDAPLWAASKSRKHIDVLREVAKTLADTERLMASQPVEKLTESALEAEQLRLEDVLHIGDMTVEEFQRLREIDFYLEAMRQRRGYGPAREEWQHESTDREE